MRGVKLLYGAAVFMVIGCILNVIVDYRTYCVSFTSAPFWLWFMVDALIWLVPALLAFLAGLIVSIKLRNKEKTK